MKYSALITIAREEFIICLRGRWILVFSLLFTVLTLGIAYFGTVTAGVVGLQGFERTTASLLNLVLYLVPLLGLALGTLNISREYDGNELLFSQPLRRSEILYGRLLGLFGAISSSLCVGFGIAELIIWVQIGDEGMLRFLGLVSLSIALAAVFLALGALIGLMCGPRILAFGMSLFVWFFFVFLYDLVVIGLTFVVDERTANLLIFLSIFGNPIDLVRVSSLLMLGDATIFGAAGAALLKFLGGELRSQALLITALLGWLGLIVIGALRTARRADF